LRASYLVPFALAHYVTVINPFYTTFITGGEAAVRRLERGVDAFGTWGQSKVYIVRAYDTSRVTGPIDLLRRRFILCEYYVMFDHLRKHKFNEKQYDTTLRSVQYATHCSICLTNALTEL
jgi:hypothetical protein